MLKVEKYCLPDIRLLNENEERFSIWIPDKTYIVLGASNKIEESLFEENTARDNVTILKRPSGGQAVVLTPNNLVISAIFTGEKILKPKDVFSSINLLIISALEEEGVNGLSLMGTSDISLSGKKISGSAIYRNKDSMLYHAVLNMGEPASTFSKYLKHPSKEPDYRNGRVHEDFITSVAENKVNVSLLHLIKTLKKKFENSDIINNKTLVYE